MTLRISPTLSLPLDLVTQACAILAKRRVGKSYTARRIVEELLRAHQQVIILDPKGDWWGIRSAADGRGPGLPVTIFGGGHADVELTPSSGEVTRTQANGDETPDMSARNRPEGFTETHVAGYRSGMARSEVVGGPPAAALRKGAREMLRVLVSMGRPLSRVQVATLAGLSSKSGTFSDYLSNLRTAGFIADHGVDVVATPAGRAAIGPTSSPASTAELVGLWKGKLRKGARAMLDTLVAVHPKGLSRDELGRRVGMSVESGTFSDYLSNLVSNGLAEKRGREVFASGALFLGGRR